MEKSEEDHDPYFELERYLEQVKVRKYLINNTYKSHNQLK